MSKITVREYKKDDFEMVKAWWDDVGEMAPTPSMMVEGSSFVAEINKTPVVAVTVYLTNGPVVWVDNFIGNPNFEKDRRLASQYLSDHIARFSKDLGYEGMVCFAPNNKLKNRYEELGYRTTMVNLTSMGRNL